MTKRLTFREFAEIRNGVWPWYPEDGASKALHILGETVADWCDFQASQAEAGAPLDVRDWLQARKQEEK